VGRLGASLALKEPSLGNLVSWDLLWAAPSEGKMKRILVVDDQANIRHLVEMSLHSEDRQIIEAESGEEAIDIAHQRRLDLIILDLVMPGGMDGLQALEILKADPQTRDCPVLILSAWGEQPERDRAFSFGASDYLTKPFKLDLLQQKVEEILH
jgi:CheY-like chemotaxis protein